MKKLSLFVITLLCSLPAYGQFGNATSIRGRPISTTAPTDLQCLTFVAATGKATWGSCAVGGSGITSLNGLIGSSQTFGVPGTTGTAPAWVSAGSAHTLNIPLASAAGVTLGGISKTFYDTIIVNGGALGTPLSGVMTNMTGLVAAAMPNAGVFTGDVTTTFPAITVAKVNGIAYSATAAAHSVEVITTANTTATAKVIPDCVDTGGNHLNFTQSTDAFSCGTSGGGSGSLTVKINTSTTLGTEATLIVNGATGLVVSGSNSPGVSNTVTLTPDTAVLGALAVANSWTAKQTFPKTSTVAGINIPETTAPVGNLAAGDRYQNSTSHADCHYNGSSFDCDTINPMTTAGDIIVSGASGVPARYPLTTTGGFLYNNGTTRIDRIPLFSDLSGVATAAQLPPTPAAAGTTHSLTGPREYWFCTGTCTVTPPVPAAGYEFCVANSDNVTSVITLAALGSSARYETTARTSYGTAGTGTAVSGGAAGDKFCMVGLDSTHYLTLSYQGTWTVN